MNSHPLFAESNARHRTTSLMRTRKLLVIIGIGTLATVFCWASVTFVGDSVRPYHDPLNPNETVLIEVPRLMFGAHYIWDPNDGMAYVFTFLYQSYKAALGIPNRHRSSPEGGLLLPQWDHLAVSHPRSSHARRSLTWLSGDERGTH
ncbi:hypothetical protein J6590_072698 [Homalodisca vitripennis]|nr:hypothetical protein J6590_072698 [Homalodisca vitripennis]